MTAQSTISFLDRLDAESREQLIAVARPVSFVAGAILVRHGEAASGAYVLRTGTAEAVVTLPGGESLTVAKLGPGAIFGEMALIELGSCTATVRATSSLDGWFIAHEDFRAMVSQCTAPAIRLQHEITAVLAGRIAALNEQVLARPAQEDGLARPASKGDPLNGVSRSRHAPFDAVAFLPRLPLFQRFSSDEIDEIVSGASYIELPRGHGIFAAETEASAAFVVVRGAAEIIGIQGSRERRIAVLGPGQLVGYLSVLRGAKHSSYAYARESALLLELPAPLFRERYFGASRASARLRNAVQVSLLGSMARTNRALTRFIAQAKLDASHRDQKQLEAALHSQLATADAANG